jgi:hypothetical protein
VIVEPEVLQILEECAAESEDWFRTSSCLKEKSESFSGVSADQVEALRAALDYLPLVTRQDEYREIHGVYGPMWEIDGRSYPMPVKKIPDEALNAWIEYHDQTESPMVVSRLADLLWLRKAGEEPVMYARSAVDAYLVESVFEGMALVESLSRALEISMEMKDKARIAAATSRIMDEATREIEVESEHRPGVPLGLLEPLAALPESLRPSRLPGLLDQAEDRYGADPYLAQSISEIRQQIADQVGRKELQRQEVLRWLDEARNADGMTKFAWLQDALSLARTHGFSDLADIALIEIQSLSEEDLGLRQVSVEIPLAELELEEKFSEFIDKLGSLEACLGCFGSWGPPSGDYERNIEGVRDNATQFPLRRLITNFVIGEMNSLVESPQSEEDHDQADLIAREQLAIRTWSILAAQFLDLAFARFGVPSRAEADGLFEAAHVDAAVAERLGDSLSRYAQGDLDGAIHIALPQIEAAIRGTASRIGLPVIRNPQGASSGGVRSLRTILGSMKGRMDESWRRYLINSLAEPTGVNLRNSVSHGTYGRAAKLDATICVHIALHIRLWKLSRS